jgi:hypothetical protein
VSDVAGMELHTMPSGVRVAFDADRHRYYLVHDDDVVPLESVTKTLGVCPKPGLPWWGMKVGLAGALKLAEMGELEREVDGEGRLIDVDDAVDLLNLHRLTVNHVRDGAGDRGTETHEVGEGLAAGVIPDLDAIEPERRGYPEGLIAAWLDLRPQPVATERVVCSVEHGIAGRYDLVARIPEGRTAVVDAESGWREEIPAGLWLLDYKTPKAVYEAHVLQLESYEMCSVESGYEPTDHRGVIRLLPDGRYELVESWTTKSHYLAALRFHRALEEGKADEPRRPRECKRRGHYFIPAGRELLCPACRGATAAKVKKVAAVADVIDGQGMAA